MADRHLRTFEKNASVRAFDEQHGWVLGELSDGQGNEQKGPEVRYFWHPFCGRTIFSTRARQTKVSKLIG